MDKHLIIRNAAILSLVFLVGFFLQTGQDQEKEMEIPVAPTNWVVTPNVNTNFEIKPDDLEELACDRVTLWNKFSEEDHALFLRNEFLGEHPEEEIYFFEFKTEKTY